MNTFNRKAFVKAAEGYLNKRLQDWLTGIKGTALEPLVLTMAKQNWILPNEGFEAILISNVFPLVDLKSVTDAVEAGRTPENEAKRYIASLVDRSIQDIRDELQKLEDCGTPPMPEPLPPEVHAAQAEALGVPPEELKTQNDPPLAGEVRGTPTDIKSSVVTRYKIEVENHFLYTHDKALAEIAKSAKSQSIHMIFSWTLGEFGCRLESLKPIDKPKPINEVVP